MQRNYIEKDEVASSLKQIFKIEEERASYTVYNNAYARENLYFSVNKFVDKCKNLIFVVIHNILIRKLRNEDVV